MDELIYYFVDDNELLELINSDASYTLNDDSIMEALEKVFNVNNDSQSITFWDTWKITTMEYMFNNKEQFNELLIYSLSKSIIL